MANDGSTHGDSLALPTGQLGRFTSEQRFELEHPRGLEYPLPALGLSYSGILQREAHVLLDGHVRVQRVTLKHHGDVTCSRSEVRDVQIGRASCRERVCKSVEI